LKFPAYGRQLFDARDHGDEPQRVVLVYGDDWYTDGRFPRLAVKPADYIRATLDFRVVSGLPVDVVDRSTDEQYVAIDGVWALYWLGAEVAHWASEVRFMVAAWSEGAGVAPMEIIDAAWGNKSGPQWPLWWSDELNQDYGKRQKQYWTERTKERAAAIGSGVQKSVSMGRAR